MSVSKPKVLVRAGAMFGATNYDVDAVSDATGVDCTGSEDFTQQQFKDECDINTIVRRFGLTGELPESLDMPRSGDFVSDISDFQSAMELITHAQQEFMTVPAEIRARFHNDPGELISFLDDPANRDEAVKLGLVKPPPEKPRDVVTAVDELKEAFKSSKV